MKAAGRLYRAVIDITFVGVEQTEESTTALFASVRRELGDDARPELDWATTRYSDLRIAATLRAEHPLAALTRLSDALDRGLLAAGTFADYDSTGRRMQVAPAQPT
jgi:hypothetical protein